MRKTIWLIAIVSGAAFAAEESAWTDYDRALKLYEAKDYERAEALFRAAVKTDQRVEDAHYYIGLMLDKRGDVKGAVAELEQVTESFPTYPFAQGKLGTIALAAKDLKKAAGHFEKTATLNPTRESWMQLCIVRTELKEYPAAEEALKKATALSPKDLSVADAWGRIYVETDRFDLALEKYTAISETVPSDAAAHFMRAVCLQKMDRGADAVPVLEAVLKLDPAHKGAIQRLIDAWEGDVSKKEQVEALKKRLEWLVKNPPKVRPIPKG